MQRLTRYCAGWVVAATVATSVSYAAIQNLVTTAAIGAPIRTVPLTEPVADPVSTSVPSPPAPTGTATVGRPTATRAARARAHRPTATRSPSTPASSGGSRAASSPTPSPSSGSTSDGTAHGYTLKGGLVTLDLTADSARLVSAVPAAGYQTETWRTQYWMRIDFVSAAGTSSLIVTWFDQAPQVQQFES